MLSREKTPLYHRPAKRRDWPCTVHPARTHVASRSEGNGSSGSGYRLVIDSVPIPGGEGCGRSCIGHGRQRGAAGSSGFEKAPGTRSIAGAVEE